MDHSKNILKRLSNQEKLTVIFLIIGMIFFSINRIFFYTSLGTQNSLHYLAWVFMFAFAALHAKKILGLKNTVIAILITFPLTLILEFMGTQGLIPNCTFYYNQDKFIFYLLGEVPLLILLSWFVIFYCGLIMSYIILNGLSKDFIKNMKKNNLLTLLIGMITTGLITVSLDLMHDPVSLVDNVWIWVTKGSFYGIPIMNFIGWFTITSAIYLLFHLYLIYSKKEIEFTKYSKSWFIMLPVIFYIFLLIWDVIRSIQLNRFDIIPVGFIFMSVFIIMSYIVFIKNKEITKS